MKKLFILLLISTGAYLTAMDAPFNATQMNLFRAIQRNSKLDVSLLIDEFGADVNGSDDWGITPLMAAAKLGSKEICELLIAKGANIMAQDFKGETTLTRAAWTGNKEICQFLIDQMIKPTKEEEHYLVMLSGSLNRTPLPTQREVEQLPAKILFDDFKQQKKLVAREQIMKIQNQAMRNELLAYLRSL